MGRDKLETGKDAVESSNVDILRFRELDECDIPLLKRYFELYPTRSCDFTIGGTFLWKELYDYEIAEYDNSLLIKGYLKDADTFVFYQPLGNINQETFNRLIDSYCAERGLKHIVIIPEETGADYDSGLYCDDSLYVQGWKEYLYNIEKFCGFPGKKMEKKRNHLHRFSNSYSPYEVVEITQDMSEELIEFTKKFCATHHDNELAQYESRQVIEALKSYDEYPYYGVAIKKDGKILAFSFGEKVGDTFFVHVEKGDIEYEGVYQAISSEMAQHIKSRYPDVRLLNREDDMGYESLKKSKESYHPDIFVYKKIASKDTNTAKNA